MTWAIRLLSSERLITGSGSTLVLLVQQFVSDRGRKIVVYGTRSSQDLIYRSSAGSAAGRHRFSGNTRDTTAESLSL